MKLKEREEQAEASQAVASAVIDEIRAELSNANEKLAARESYANAVELALRSELTEKDESKLGFCVTR